VPELPEVEVTRRRVAPLVVGRTIAEITTSASRRLFLTPPSRLRQQLLGRRVDAVERLGKYLLFRLHDGGRLCVHLGMTGQLVTSNAFERPCTPGGTRRRTAPDRHIHLELGFADTGPTLFFRDPRQFGRVLGLTAGHSHLRLERLGPDALAIGLGEFASRVRARRAPIKAVLLDQKLLAGVGNIYADEALFLARVLPTRRACRLTREDSRRLLSAVQGVLRRAIRAGGTTVSDFVHPDGSDGGFQRRCRVYGREGQGCTRCGTPIRRVVLAQRSAHFCPRCQQ
jgi:formamidopyrimidine-DNA glycosylase